MDIDFLRAKQKMALGSTENKAKIYEEINGMLSDDGSKTIDIDALYAALFKDQQLGDF